MRTIEQALRNAGFKIRRAKTGKKWPRKKGKLITVTITTNAQFKPGTGFAFNFMMRGDGK